MSLAINTRIWLFRYAVCVLLAGVSFVLLPLLVLAMSRFPETSALLPRTLRNLLFFWPQYFLLLGGLEDRATGARHLEGTSTLLSIVVWLTLLAGYTWATRALRFGYVLVALLPALALMLQLLVGMVVHGAGFAPVLDGP